MGVMFQFVLTALGTQEEQVIDFQRRSRRGTGLGRLPLFNAADTIAQPSQERQLICFKFVDFWLNVYPLAPEEHGTIIE
ncbi:hypothetical protein ACLOJK_031162 [Asimina triloba]